MMRTFGYISQQARDMSNYKRYLWREQEFYKIIDLLIHYTRSDIINKQDINGHTLLTNCIYNKVDTEIIKYILHKGANPNIKLRNGGTAYDLSLQYNYSENATVTSCDSERAHKNAIYLKKLKTVIALIHYNDVLYQKGRKYLPIELVKTVFDNL
jgi:ankyrin repeat protein